MRLVFLLAGIVICSAAFAQQHLNIITYNIRLDIKSDSLNAWPHRKEMVSSQVLFHQAHVLGVQEALPVQMEDLRQRLPQYKTIGVGRDDGKNKGEYSALFIDTTRLKVLAGNTIWLSQTPTIAGSKGWDAAYPRIVTWAKLRDRQTNKIFFCFNTHFDHMGQIARRESAGLLLQTISQIAGNTTSIITGDFNATPLDEPIKILTDKTSSFYLTDTRSISQTPHYGPLWTFNGFKNPALDGPLIDYIFIHGKAKVLQHATLSPVWNNRFASDHFAVFARLSFK